MGILGVGVSILGKLGVGVGVGPYTFRLHNPDVNYNFRVFLTKARGAYKFEQECPSVEGNRPLVLILLISVTLTLTL